MINVYDSYKPCMKKAYCFSFLFFLFFLFDHLQAQIPPPVLWLMGDSVVLNGSKVSNLVDVSGHGRDAIQNNASNQPAWISSVPKLNNKPVIRFDRNNSNLLLINSSVLVGEIFIIANYNSSGTTFDNYDGLLTGQSAGYLLIGNQTFTTFFPGSPVSGNIFINGANSGDDFAPLSNYKVLSAFIASPYSLFNDLQIGLDRTNSPRFWNGDVAEVIIYDTTLTSLDRQQVIQYLQDKYAPPVNLGSDITTLCSVTLDAGARFVSYKWNNSVNDTNQTFTVTNSGTYSVDVVDIFGRHSVDTVVVTVPFFNQLRDTSICSGNTLTWNTSLSHHYSFVWSNGSTDSLLTITTAGQYWVTVTDTSSCVFVSDTVNVTIDDFSSVASLGPDVSLCSGNSIGLVSAANRAQVYLWSDGSTTSTLVINSSGTYALTVTDAYGCTKTDGITISVSGTAPAANFSSAATCLGQTMQFTDLSTWQGSDFIQSWHWDFGDTASGTNDSSFLQNPSHIYSDTLVHSVTLIVTAASGCNNSITKSVSVFPSPIAGFTYSGSCVGTLINFNDTSNVFNDPSPSWHWDFGDPSSGSNDTSGFQNSSHSFNVIGSYTVSLTVTTSNGCTATVQHQINILSAVACFSPNQLSGLSLWLEADKGVLKSNDSIYQWNDQSGSNRNASQNIDSLRPTFVDSIIKLNYKPVARFDTSDMLINSSAIVGEVFVLANYTKGPVFLDYDGLLTGQTAQIIITGYQGADSLYPGSLDPASFTVNGVHTPHLQPLDLYKIISGYNNPPVNFNNFLIGYDRGVGNRFWGGDLAEVIIYNSILTSPQRDQVMQYLHYKYAPPVDLGPDKVTICPVTLDAGARFTSYKWNGDTAINGQTFPVTQSGTYNVEAVDIFGIHSFDTVTITYAFFNQLHDTAICTGNTLTWNTNLDHRYTFQWSDGSSDSLLQINSAGQYWVKIMDLSGCLFSSNTITVSLDDFAQVATLGADDTLCSGNRLGLTVGANRAQYYLWNDASTGDSLVVNNTGTYWVTATDSFGCLKQDTINVVIKGVAPVANYSVMGTCFGQLTQFNDLSTAPSGHTLISWKWDFDDTISGSLNSATIPSPTHLFTDTLIHHVSLIVGTDSGCYDVIVKSISTIPKPKADYSYTNACINTITTFNDASTARDIVSQWFWDFGDPASGTNDTSSLQNPTHVFSVVGNYSVNLIIKTNNGCGDTITKSVNVQNAISPDFSYDPACWLTSSQFHNFSTPFNLDSVCIWDFGNGTYDQNCNPSHIYAFPGSYQVTLTMIADGGCVSSITKNVIVSDIPVAKPTSTPACIHNPYMFVENSTISSGSIVRWDWQIPELGVHFDNIQNPVYTFDTVKTYVVKLKVTSDAGCTDTSSTTITVYPLAVPNFTFSPPYGAPPLTVRDSNLSTNATSYQWDFGDGTAGSTSPNPLHTYTDTGQFVIHLIATSAKGCSDSITKRIYVITPVIDVAVTHVSASLANNQLAISAIIANLGTVDVDSVIMQARLDNGTSIDEKNTHSLPTGGIQAYQFVAHFNVEPSITISYYCVSAIHPNNVTADNDTADDKKCSSLLKQISLVEPYPNPFTSILHLDVVAPFEDQLTIELYNNLGQEVVTLYDGEVSIGLNSILANLSSLADGIYTLRFTFLDQQLIRQVMKAEVKK